MLAPHLQETIESLAAGETAREMAARLYLSPNTVKSRLRTLYQQLGARDQAHAVAIGFRLGVLRAPGAAEPDDDRQPVVIGSLNPDSLREIIAELTALLRIVERVRPLPGGHLPDLLRRVGELATSPHDDPRGVLARIAQIAAEAGFTAEGPGAEPPSRR
ncbi:MULTISPECIES: helix-turn-helix transcriptional regulator [unclassified Actinoplanes]|uniref:helix-turn-helix domain-containing protein n=1 Tax=unclassified Actinoplanes TaxID=2626549 RepID=UPI0002F23341|nr:MULTISPECIES: helix-turn-helix transcriptional regulator [unclassified Actinoplanes]